LGAGIAGYHWSLGLYKDRNNQNTKPKSKVKEKDPEEHEFIDFKRGD